MWAVRMSRREIPDIAANRPRTGRLGSTVGPALRHRPLLRRQPLSQEGALVNTSQQ